MNRKRDRLLSRLGVRTLSAPNASASGTSPAPAPPLPLPPAPPTATLLTPPATTSHSPALAKALAKELHEVPEAERAAFTQAAATIDEQTLLAGVRYYDAAHKNDSAFRSHAEGLSEFLSFLDRLMGGVAIGIQASPEVSSLVVGSVRIIIDLALKFTMYFSKLTEMLCNFQDYLGPLAEYAEAAKFDSSMEKMVVEAYANVIRFGWKARRVFIDNTTGRERKWTSLRTFMHQHWEPFESEFETIQGNLQHNLNILQHYLPLQHYDFARKSEQARQRKEERNERSLFLVWVSSIDFEPTHRVIYARKQENTCDWLIKEPEYQRWLQAPGSSILWSHGKPGIGKSVLASNVIEDITTRVGLREDAAFCFAYYNYRDPQLKDLHGIICALIKQLCRRRARIPLQLLRTKHNDWPSSLIGTQEQFLSLVENLSQVYVVLDALDECPKQQREDVLKFITGIVEAQTKSQVKVFVTSRRESDIIKTFEARNVPTIQIQIENVTADIETFVRSQVEELLIGEHGKTLYVTDDALKQKIIHTLSNRAEGMFLWVSLQLDHLCEASEARRDHVLEDALEDLPLGLNSTYIRILEQIEDKLPYFRKLALKCFEWIIYARVPLRTRELQHALAIDSEYMTEQSPQLDSPKVILETCCNLLEEIDGSIRPVHYTVQEFLTTAVEGLSQQSIRAQLLDLADQPGELFERINSDVLAVYACKSFDFHILKCVEPFSDVLDQLEILLQKESTYLAAILQIKILGDDARVDVWASFNRLEFLVSAGTVVYSTGLYNIMALRERFINQTLPAYVLHLAASAGLDSAIHRILTEWHDIDEKDGNHSTALYYACLNGHDNIVRVLIEKNADVNAVGGYYGSALQVASYVGQENVVRTLLNNGADVNAKGGEYGNALQAACRKGHEHIVKMLLNSNANVNAQGGFYGNALQAACLEGQELVVEVLLDNDANSSALGGRWGSALGAAAAGNHEQILRMLLSRKIDVNLQDKMKGNALCMAAGQGHMQMVRILLGENADVNMEGPEGTALQLASERGHEDVAKMLLEKGADVNMEGPQGTALRRASYGGYEKIVKMLLEKGADVHAEGRYRERRNKHGTALQAASRGGHEQVVQMLLDAGSCYPEPEDEYLLSLEGLFLEKSS